MRAWGISVDCWGMNIPFFSYFFGYENCALLLRHLDETELLCHMAACRCNAAGADLCNQKTRSFKWNWSWECCVLHGHGRFYVCISLVVERALASAGITAVIGLRQAWTYWEMQHLGSRLQGIVNVWLLMWSAVLWSVLFFVCVHFAEIYGLDSFFVQHIFDHFASNGSKALFLLLYLCCAQAQAMPAVCTLYAWNQSAHPSSANQWKKLPICFCRGRDQSFVFSGSWTG